MIMMILFHLNHSSRQKLFSQTHPSGAECSPPEAPRGAPRHPLREGGQGGDGDDDDGDGVGDGDDSDGDDGDTEVYLDFQGGQGKQVEGQVQHQHDSVAEEPRLGQVQVCQLEGKYSHTGSEKIFAATANMFFSFIKC